MFGRNETNWRLPKNSHDNIALFNWELKAHPMAKPYVVYIYIYIIGILIIKKNR